MRRKNLNEMVLTTLIVIAGLISVVHMLLNHHKE